MSDTRDLVVRRLDDRSEVQRIAIASASTQRVDRVLAGVLRNLDTERFYVDDSAFDDLYQSPPNAP